MSLPSISGEFGVVDAPDLRFGDDGKPWLKIRGVSKERRMNDKGVWEDVGDPCYLDILVRGKQAENLTESITKGDAIVVTGRLTQREWTNKDGVKQKAYGIRAETVGVSTQFTPAPTPKFTTAFKSTPEAQQSGGDPF
jgi:single-strand DNA-binding protein